MRFHYALSLERAHILTLDSQEVGKGDAKHRSFCLPESEQASRQARQGPDGMTSRREMNVFPALAMIDESRSDSNALRTCEPGRRKGLG